MNITDILRRSCLIMPVNQPRFVDKAYLRGADAIVLDLEDSVPPAEKGHARPMSRWVIETLEEGVARGTASVSVDGRMIDTPIVEKAHRLMARANAIAIKEARKTEAMRLAGVA